MVAFPGSQDEISLHALCLIMAAVRSRSASMGTRTWRMVPSSSSPPGRPGDQGVELVAELVIGAAVVPLDGGLDVGGDPLEFRAD